MGLTEDADFGKKISFPDEAHLKKIKFSAKSERNWSKAVRTPENIAAVAERVCEAPLTLIHRRS